MTTGRRRIRRAIHVAHRMALSLLLSAGIAHAQSLTLSIRQPLPNQLSLGDLWELDVLNTSGAPVSVVFRAHVTDATAGAVLDAQSGTLELAPGARNLDARRLQPISILQSAPGVSTQLGRLSSFPDGRYTVCVEAIPSGGGSPLATACIDQDVSTVLPPVLIGPYNGEPITDPLIIWSWFMQPSSRTGAKVVCHLKVVEILPNQTPEEAMRLNPPILLREDLRSSVWQTNEAVRKLHAGQTYAWQVTARLGPAATSQSEIWTFQYAEPSGAAPAAPAAVEAPYLPGGESPDGSAGASVPSARDSAGAPAGDGAALPSGTDGTASSAASADGAPPVAPPADAGSTAQDSTSIAPIRFHVRNLALGETANRPGALSQQPPQFGRLEIDPTITIYGSPLTLNLLLATDQSNESSQITRGALGFQPRGRGGPILRQQIGEAPTPRPRTPLELRADSLRNAGVTGEELNRQLDELAKLAPVEATGTERELQALAPGADAASKIPSFAFGSVAPDFSGLLMSGVTMNGGMVEYNPNRTYGALAVGKVQREDVPSTLAGSGGSAPQLFRDLYAARVGMGRKEGSHLILSTLYARDDDQTRSILALADTSAGRSLQDNWVMGMAGRVSRPGGRAVLDGEVNASLFNRDRQGPSVEGNSDASSLGSLFGRQNVRDQSAVDWAGSLRGSWAAGANRTRFAAGVRFVGPGYASVGVRALRTDLLSYDGAWDQSVLHDRLGLGARMSREETGVVLPDRGNAFVTRADARADWHPARGPGLQLGYTFNRQDQHASGAASELRNDVNIVDARLRETRSLRSARLSTFFSFHLHHGTSTDETARNDARAFQLAELITFPSRLSLFVRAAHTHTTTGVSDDSDPRVVNLDATLTCDFPRGLANDVGTSYTSGVHTRGRGVFVGTRLGLAGGKGAFEVRWEYDDFKDLAAPPNDRIEQIARASLTLNP